LKGYSDGRKWLIDPFPTALTSSGVWGYDIGLGIGALQTSVQVHSYRARQ